MENNPFLPPPYPSLGLDRYAAADTAGAGVQRDQAGAAAAVENVQGSALAGLTIHQMIDLDAENMAVLIDRQHCATKKVILDAVMEMKARMMTVQNAAVEEERRLGAQRLAAKQAEIDLLRFELNQAVQRGKKMGDVMSKMSAAFDVTKHQKRCMALKVQAFYCWRQFAIASRQRKARMQRALQWYSVDHLKRNVLKAWHRQAQKDHRHTLARRYESALENARAEMAAGYGSQIEELRRQLAVAHEALVREAEAREKLEENMKQAFMRGVCALNIEAMSVMKRGAPPAGANPVPISLPGGPPAGSSAPPIPVSAAAAAGATASAPVSSMPGSVSATGSGMSRPLGHPGSGPQGMPMGPGAPGGAGGPMSTSQGGSAAAVGAGYGMGAPGQPGTAGPGYAGPGLSQTTYPSGPGAAGQPTGPGGMGQVGVGAAAYYRPRVVVERGPAGGLGGAASGGSGAEPPRPRPTAPAPMVRR